MKAYLDNNATTMPAPEVLDAMLPFLASQYGNPSSFHTFGSSVMPAIEDARAAVAGLIGASDASRVFFTSGGTESDNWALRGASTLDPGRPGIVTTTVEHPAVLETARQLQKEGHPLGLAAVDAEGVLDLDSFRLLLGSSVSIASVMAANNETGVIMPLAEAASLTRAAGAFFHTDAVQAAGKIPIDVERTGIDMLSLSGHKLHGPKGVGALYIRAGIVLPPLIHGGHHEGGLRAGTYNVPGIVGLGRAAELALEGMEAEGRYVSSLRDRLEQDILATCPGAMVTSGSASRLPNTVNIIFKGVESESVLTLLDMQGVSASSGSACSTGSRDPSHVLLAMDVDRTCANSAVRFSLSRYTTAAEIDYVMEIIPGIIARLRSISPFA